MNRFSSLLGGLAVIAIAIVFVMSFGPGGGQNQLKAGPDCAGEVHGKCLKASHFWATFRIAANRLEAGRADGLQIKKQIVEGLEERELLLVDAKRLGVSISDEDVTKELVAGRVRFSLPSTMGPEIVGLMGIDPMLDRQAQLPPGVTLLHDRFKDKKTQKFSADTYKKVISDLTRLSETDYRDYQKAELIAARMRTLIMSRVRVSEGEALDDFSAEKTTAKIKHLRLRPAFYRDRAIDTSEAAVTAWADKNAAEIDKAFDQRKKELGGECRDVSHIMVLLPETPDSAAKGAARGKIEAAKKRAQEEDFTTVATQISEDQTSRKDGGRMHCLTQGELQGDLKPIADALFGLKEAGKVSEIIESPRGFHLMRLDKILQGADAEKAMRARTARELYISADAKRLVAEGAKEIQAAVKGGKTLEEALAVHLAKYPSKALPAQGEPKKDEPKKDEPKKDEPKKDEPKKDEPKPVVVADPLEPKVETSLSFAATEEPFEDAQPGDSPAAISFGLTKPGDVADKLIPLRDSGLAIIVLVEKKAPAEETWQKSRDQYVAQRREKKQRDALVGYMKRLRAASQTEIKPNPEFLPKPNASASGAPPMNPFGAPSPE